MLRRRAPLLALAAALLVPLACGDDPAETAETSSTSETSPTSEAVDTPATDSTSAPTNSTTPLTETDGSSPATTAAPDGPWTYTDGAGRTIELDARPERIVAHASSAAALMSFGIRPVGIYADTAVTEDLALQDLDLDGIEIVGEEWGIISLEAVAALRPDLIVAEYWPVEGGYSGMEPGTQAGDQPLPQIAPVAGPAQGDSIATMIEDYEELAELLGADLDAPEIVASRQRFEDSLAAFRSALAAKPDLSVLALSPAEDGLYVAVPEFAAELADFQRWGMDLVVPSEPDEGFEYWQTLSWENADTYEADLVIVDERSYPSNLDVAEAQPTWETIDAVAAGAVAVWPAYWVRTYDDYAGALDELTAAVEEADADLVA